MDQFPLKVKKILKSIGLSLFLTSNSINAQFLQDTAAMNLLRKNIDYIYNMQFNNAHKGSARMSGLYPGHPFIYLYRGFLTYWENYPLLQANTSHVSFEEDLRQCIKISETNDNPAYEAEYLMANLCARGMLLSFYVDNGLIMEVIPLTISTYKYLRRAPDYTLNCSDLYYFTGIYNYYREAYPKIHPVYKSLALLFPPGDMEKGLKELHIAGINSVVLRAESNYLLAWIYSFYENNYGEAILYCKTLCEEFPENLLYFTTYLKHLLLMKQYDEAEQLLLASPGKAENNYFRAQLTIIKGIIQEKKYLNNKLAQQYYNEGISDISIFGKYGNEYSAYAYFGLSRISETNGERETSRIYRKEALKLSDFKRINFDK